MKKKIISILAIILALAAAVIAISNIWQHNDKLTNIVWEMVFISMVLNWWRAEEDFIESLKQRRDGLEMKLEAERKEHNIKLYLESVQNEFLWADQDEFTKGECVSYLQKEINKWGLDDGTTSD